MKSESGKGTIKWILIICLIAVVVFLLGKYVMGIYKREKVKNFQADLLLVQAKVEGVKGKYTLNKEENPLKGVKVSERTEEYDLNDFIQQGVLKEEEYEKYYILNDNCLNEMELQSLVGKYKGYFIVNYDDFEVIYTEGYENENGLWCYKVSDMKKERENKKLEPKFNQEENSEVTQENSNEENNTEQTQENANNESNAEQTQENTTEEAKTEETQESAENNEQSSNEGETTQPEEDAENQEDSSNTSEDEAKMNFIKNKLKLNLNKQI